MGTNTVLSATNTFRKVTFTELQRKDDHIIKKRPNVIHSQSGVGVWLGNPSIYQVN